jgi:NAD(P)-dependent dehydrogenase (short-subunit alcohol dehydrogenase family)
MSVALITGAATGIGNLTAMALAGAGHTVYASMRDPDGHNAGHARELREQAQADRRDLRIVELDVQSQVSAERAIAILGPYVTSTFAFDALAMVTSYEVSQFGIETTIVMPGAFTQGTEHFPSATRASDDAVTAAYAKLDPLVARNEAATAGLVASGVDADPVAVAEEITRILALPPGAKPFRSVVDFTQSDVEEVIAVTERSRRDFVTRMGFGALLELQVPQR